MLDHIDCDILAPSSYDNNSGSAPPTVEDERIARALDALGGAPVKKSRDEAARRLFRLLIPADPLVFHDSRYVGYVALLPAFN